ncbi:MAG: MBL fold metallo-hydrolase [Actinomycetota bacterium]|nr:MBL fold metallo-hydrolase [Actinomycetota bacterium]
MSDVGTPPATLTSLGGVGTVTGSRHLVEFAGSSLLVDCGLFQGLKELRERNWAPFPGDAAGLQAVVLTHAHLDHCGYLPRLVRQGFRGPVYVTYDTGKLMSVVLPDSGRLLEEEAGYANRKGYSRHQPALPLYTEDDAWAALDLLQPMAFGRPFSPSPGVDVEFRPAGHILGSAVTRLCLGDTTLVCSGDLGRGSHPFLCPPDPVGDADWVMIESTYGDRRHDADATADRLADVIDRTVERGGVVVIPAFAVDRTEVLLFHLHQLARAGRLPDVPIYVDSPMALAGLSIYREALADAAVDVRRELHGRPEILDLPNLEEVLDTEGSKRVSRRNGSAVIIAGAGMASGGRVVHHLARFLPDPRNTVALVGFQAEGTRGRQLVEGATSVKIHGQYVRVRAEVCDLAGFSVHADADELIGWLRTATREPSGVFVAHGEPAAAKALAGRIETELDWTAVTPAMAERLSLAVSR